MSIIELPYGGGTLPVAIPDQWLGEVVEPRAVAPAADASTAIAAALDRPIGAPTLAELVTPGQEVAVIIDDRTRKTPARLLLPPVLQRLHAVGVPARDIRIVVALGTHRPMTQSEIVAKVGAGVATHYEIVNTPASAHGEMVYLGTSSNGIPAWVHRAVAEADVRVGLGMITPHLDAGFSGGAKIILPGVCGTATVDTFHARAADVPTNQLGNPEAPLRLDLEQFVGERVRLDFIVNVVLTPGGGVYQCVTGDYLRAHRAGIAHARQVFGVPVRQRYPIMVVNCYPYDHDLWQSTKGLWCGEMLAADGGTLVLLTAAEEGHSNYPLLPHYVGRDPNELKRELDAGQTEDPKAAATGILIGHMKQRLEIALVSAGLTCADADVMGMRYYESVEEAVEAEVARLPRARRAGTVALITQGGYTLPLRPGVRRA